MGFFSNALGRRVVTLATGSSMGSPISLNVGIKSTDRVKRELLESDYRFDPVTFNMINKQTQLILHAGFRFSAKRVSNQKFFDNFFENIGKVGEEITKEELAEYILQDMIMYGNSFVELIYDARTDSKIVDLKTIPEKKMDYAKNAMGEVAVDEMGKPIGFVMTLPWGANTEGKGDKVPMRYVDKVTIDGNQIFFLPKRIAHFKLFTYGDRFYGIGLIEPGHSATFRKLKIEEARANEIYTRGTNTIIATVGNTVHEAGPQELSDALDQISKFRHDRFFSFPDWVKISTLPVQDNDAVDKTLDYMTTLQSASAGMPKAFATGSGEATNRATLNNQQRFLELSSEHIVKKFTAAFKRYVLKRISETNNISEVPDIVWGDVRAEEKNEKAERIRLYVKEGILDAEEAREYAITSEDLDIPVQRPTPDTEKGLEKEEKQTEELGGFYEPEGIDKRVNIIDLDNTQLLYYHDQIHILWKKLEEGYKLDWTFLELHSLHNRTAKELIKRDIPHLSPINILDTVH